MKLWVDRRSLQSRSGFTLVELLLVVVLMFLLLGAIVFSFSTAQSQTQLTEGAAQFEALLHFARAQAAFAGKRVELRLTSPLADERETARPDGGGFPARRLEVLWEIDPIQQPGLLQTMEEATAFLGPMQDLVEIIEIRAPSDSPAASGFAVSEGSASASSTNGGGLSMSAENLEGGEAGSEPLSIWLFPDGSSDSGEFGLRLPFSEGTQTLWISLDGTTGAIRRRMEAAQDAAPLDEKDAGPRAELANQSGNRGKK